MLNLAVLIGTCLLFTSKNREMNRNSLNCHSLSVFFEPELNENGTEKDPFGRENNTPTAWLSAGTFATRYNLQADHLNLVAQ